MNIDLSDIQEGGFYYSSYMTPEKFSFTDFFQNYTGEKWGDYRRVGVPLVYWLDELRDYIGKPIIIHTAYATGGHSKKSYHYRGMAVDFHVKGMSPRELFFNILKFPFQGVGLYRWGCHTDVRESPIKVLWKRKNGVYSSIKKVGDISDEVYSVNTR